jgi:RimJ/RimL family protein N-acetyltransferase
VDSKLEEWVSSAIKQREQHIRLAFTVIDLAADTVVGSSSLGNLSWRDKRVEIGWTGLGRKYQGL